jgi:hypothetical protein
MRMTTDDYNDGYENNLSKDFKSIVIFEECINQIKENRIKALLYSRHPNRLVREHALRVLRKGK